MAVRRSPVSNRRRVWAALTSWPAVILFGVLAVWAGSRASFMYSRYVTRMDALESAQANLAALEDRHDYLTETIARLKTEEGIEEEIRERFPYSKEGEAVILIVDDRVSSGTAPLIPDTDAPWWQFWR